MRALEPVREGQVGQPGRRVHYEVYGGAGPTVFLLMPNVITQCRAWKAQIPFLARTCQVVTADPRGNGGSDRPTEAAAYAVREMVDDAWAVLHEIGAGGAVLCGVCSGASLALVMAAEQPGRVAGVVAVNPSLRLAPAHPWQTRYDFEAEVDPGLVAADGWARLNRQSWQQDWPGFARFFFEQLFPEPHSTKQIEDCVGWATDSTPEVMLADADAPLSGYGTTTAAQQVCAAVRCPVLVVTGTEDRCQPPERGAAVAELTGGEHVVLHGAGHLPMARDPVVVNRLLREFVRRVADRGGTVGQDERRPPARTHDSTSSAVRGRAADRFRQPSSVITTSSSIRTPMPRYSSGTSRSSALK
jgi:pimeloyl-ACP methyl ester carboxylesterase